MARLTAFVTFTVSFKTTTATILPTLNKKNQLNKFNSLKKCKPLTKREPTCSLWQYDRVDHICSNYGFRRLYSFKIEMYDDTKFIVINFTT